MFSILKNSIEARAREAIEDMRRRLSEMSCGEVQSNRYFKSLLTPVAQSIVNSSPPDAKIPKEALNKMMARVSRSENKRFQEELRAIIDAEGSSDPEYIYITVEWKKSKCYGANPTATVCAGGRVTTASVSGCGYDKESASIAYALNKSAPINRLWYSYAESGREFPYSMMGGIKDKTLPIMDGGCGMSSVKEVFAALGYKCSESHGKMFDSYTFERKDKNGETDH